MNCLECDRELTRGQLKYCDYECRAVQQRRNAHFKKCVFCGDEFKAVPSAKRRKHCSAVCVGLAKRKDLTDKEKYSILNDLRKNTKDKAICKICGRTFKVRNDQDPRYTWWCRECRKVIAGEYNQGYRWMERMSMV